MDEILNIRFILVNIIMDIDKNHMDEINKTPHPRRVILTFVTQNRDMRKVATTMKRVKSSLCLWSSLNSSISPVITDSMPPIYKWTESKQSVSSVKSG